MANDECVLSVEELSAREAGKRVDNTSQPSGSHVKLNTLIQNNIRTPTYPSWLEKDLNSLIGEEDEDEQRGDPTTFPKPKIQSFPDQLMSGLERYFQSRSHLLTHIRIRNLRETYTSKLFKRFIKETSTDKGKDLYKKISNNIKELEYCFDRSFLYRIGCHCGSEFDKENVAEYLFLVGCLTLQFIHSLVENEIKKFGIRNDEIAFAQWDLFLLYNQLPYQLLKLLMNGDDDEEDNQNDDKKKKKKKSSNNKYEESIKKFIRMNAVVPHNYMHTLSVNIESKQQEPAHLLELLQMAHVSQQSATRIWKRSIDQYYLPKSFRSAKELNNVGITFKPNKSCTFTDVAFATRFLLFGELTLAPLMVDESTISKLMNMVAFETCTHDKFWVTSYICFINSLLRGPEDVKVLSSHKIILNYIGNEQQVVDLFRDITNNLIPNPDAYHSVYIGIEEHLSGRLKLVTAFEWLHAHFDSTWSVLAFLGAISTIVLTLIQTYFTAYPPSKG